MYSRVVLVGRLTRDPEVKQTTSGKSVGKLGLAVNRTVNKNEETTFVDVEVWEKQAELCAQYLAKGRQVLVEGRLKQDSWEDKEGNKRSKLLVVGERVVFLGSGNKSEQSEQSSDESEDPSSNSFGDDVPF